MAGVGASGGQSGVDDASKFLFLSFSVILHSTANLMAWMVWSNFEFSVFTGFNLLHFKQGVAIDGAIEVSGFIFIPMFRCVTSTAAVLQKCNNEYALSPKIHGPQINCKWRTTANYLLALHCVSDALRDDNGSSGRYTAIGAAEGTFTNGTNWFVTATVGCLDRVCREKLSRCNCIFSVHVSPLRAFVHSTDRWTNNG